MSNNNNIDSHKISVGLDIGTTKVCAIMLQPDKQAGNYKILGSSFTENNGVNRGVIANIDNTTNAIKKVITELESKTGNKIEEVVVGIAGDHIESLSEISTIAINNKEQIVEKQDVERVIDELRKSRIAKDRTIIHIVPYEFIIDGQDGVTQPVGMYGVRLQANVHIVTGKETAVKNIYHCIDRAGLKVLSVVLEPIASSVALLSEDEKEVGVCLIDVGGGTTDITIFKDSVLRYTSIIAIGGNKVTDDVRMVFGTTKVEAERLKRDYGWSYKPAIMTNDELLTIKGVGSVAHKEIKKEELCNVIQPRVEEVFEMCAGEIIKSGFSNGLGAGIVLTGGSSLLRGTDELAARIFNMPVRIGYPSGDKYTGLSTEIESPIYSTAVGLAIYAVENNKEAIQTTNEIVNDNEPQVAEVKEEETSRVEKQSFFNKAKDFLTKL